jgi:hypothetical protein
MTGLSANSLIGVWFHSREEDTPTERIYRRADYAFPASRARPGFELKPDGEYVELGIGPTDAVTKRQGRWELAPDGTLTMGTNPGIAPGAGVQVVEVSRDRLVLKK